MFKKPSVSPAFYAVRGKRRQERYLVVANQQPAFPVAVVESSRPRGQYLLWEDHSDLCWSPQRNPAENGDGGREGGRDFPTWLLYGLPTNSSNSTQMSFQFTSAPQSHMKILFLAVKFASVAAQVLPQAMDPLSPWHRLYPTTSQLPKQCSWPPPVAQPWSGQPAFEKKLHT